MARSVSFASGSEWVLYTYVEADEDDHDGIAWDDFIGNLRAAFMRAFPSLSECDRWLDREDHAILENCHAYIGVSEYCGLVSVWCVPKERGWWQDASVSALREQWAASIERKATRVLESVAPRLDRVATFSNGEAIYRRAS